MGQAALLLEIVVGPALKLRHRVLRRRTPGVSADGHLPDRRLGAVLAELERVRLGGLRPGAGGAHEALGLVLHPQQLTAADLDVFPRQMGRDGPEGCPTPGRPFVGLDHHIADGFDRLRNTALVEQGQRCD